MKLTGIDHIYVVHYPKLTERLKYITDFFSQHDFKDYTVLYGMDRDAISSRISDLFYNSDLKSDKMEEWGLGHSTEWRNLVSAEIANAINHYTGWEKFIHSDYKNALFIEDDIIFQPKFFELWNSLKIPEDLDIGYLHAHPLFSSTQVHVAFGVHLQADKWWFRTPDYKNRSCASYYITKKACQQLYDSLVPFALSIDNEMCLIHKKHRQVVYWLEPGLLTEGSYTKYSGSIPDRTTSFF